MDHAAGGPVLRVFWARLHFLCGIQRPARPAGWLAGWLAGRPAQPTDPPAPRHALSSRTVQWQL
eukprot:CAMPEP_0168474038 /NCGR_PEP_ID=MMETSP0228-20121227/60635_1 /TAXON_ID=133427 /ORGANISM="Protoceratium reticulatum, Strain CCCM 535 (=CCMP 1889)" /LENGTH=63 /DNA_ID=CAMNT_0008490053 /DNA_START=1 /DNA_END=188 /DNA_ORIENTATION=+